VSATPRKSRVRRAVGFLRNCLAVVGLLFIVYFLCFDVSVIVSPSMSPTLHGGERGIENDVVLSERISHWFRRPRRFEVLRFRNDDGIDVMKRIGGLPGETVSSQDNWLAINGVAPPRPSKLAFLKYYPYGKFFKSRSCDCGPNGYFVLGDHSMDSQDSRYDGPIDGNRFRGRAWMIVWPMSRFGFVK
jgi:signal peptidase I